MHSYRDDALSRLNKTLSAEDEEDIEQEYAALLEQAMPDAPTTPLPQQEEGLQHTFVDIEPIQANIILLIEILDDVDEAHATNNHAALLLPRS